MGDGPGASNLCSNVLSKERLFGEIATELSRTDTTTVNHHHQTIPFYQQLAAAPPPSAAAPAAPPSAIQQHAAPPSTAGGQSYQQGQSVLRNERYQSSLLLPLFPLRNYVMLVSHLQMSCWSMTPALMWGISPVSCSTAAAAASTYSRVVLYPKVASSAAASGYSSSGLSPGPGTATSRNQHHHRSRGILTQWTINNVRLQALLLQLTPVLQMVESAGPE